MKRKHPQSAAVLEKLHTESPYPTIKTAWEKGLAELKPSRAQLEKGLEIHGSVMALDHFGFLPKIFTPELGKAWRALQAAQLGGRAYHLELGLMRHEATFQSPEATEEFLYALAASGLTGMIQTVAEGKSIDEDIKRMASFHGTRQKAFKHLAMAGSNKEILTAEEEEKFFFIPSVNGPPCPGHLTELREELQWIHTWHNLGIRLMHLSYNRRNVIADGCYEPANGGLSELGKDLIHKLNEEGIIVDMPHTGDQSCLDACAISQKPVMATHSGRKKFHDHPRNKSDAVLKAIAGTNGLVGVVSLPSIMGRNGNLLTLLDAVEDLAKFIGTDHVAISTDYSYLKQDPTGELVHGHLAHAEFKPAWWGNTQSPSFQVAPTPSTEHFGGSLSWTNWPLFTVGLVMKGFNDQEIEKILGANFLRVLQAHQPA